MTKTIDTLVPDIKSLFDGHDLTPEVLSKFADDLVRNFDKRFKRYGDDWKGGLYLSNVGKPLRQLWFQIASGLEGERLTPEAKLKFLYGDILEDLLILLAIEAGHEVTDLQREVDLDGVRGRIDCRIDGQLVDVKSASSYSFDTFASGGIRNRDPFGYIAQLAGYSESLDTDGGYFLVVDKTLGKLCLARFDKEELREYNVRARIKQAREALASPNPPSDYCFTPKKDGVSKTNPGGNGNYYLDTGCSYCSHKFNCWKDANDGRGLRTFLYSKGPRFFTHIEKTPQASEII